MRNYIPTSLFFSPSLFYSEMLFNAFPHVTTRNVLVKHGETMAHLNNLDLLEKEDAIFEGEEILSDKPVDEHDESLVEEEEEEAIDQGWKLVIFCHVKSFSQ